MGVVACHTVHALGVAQLDRMGAVERAQARQVERGAQVDEEGIVALADKDLGAIRQLSHRLGGKALVVRRGARPDVDGRSGKVGPKLLSLTVLHPCDRVGLSDVEVLIVERFDRPGVVEEGLRASTIERRIR